MPDVKQPDYPYPLANWLQEPYNKRPDQPYEKYACKPGDTLDTIAKTVSKPWRSLTWQDIAVFNWRNAAIREVNWYLQTHIGCTQESPDKKTYVFSNTDLNKFVWVPKLERRTPEKFRSPGKQDVGHVALDDDKNQHINTLIIRPVYSISLELGDVDALFDPIDPVGNPGLPQDSTGVQQRLQAARLSLHAPGPHQDQGRHQAGLGVLPQSPHPARWRRRPDRRRTQSHSQTGNAEQLAVHPRRGSADQSRQNPRRPSAASGRIRHDPLPRRLLLQQKQRLLHRD